MAIKVAIIGAGSAVFSKNLIGDMLWHESLRDIDLRLMDVDAERLETAEAMALSITATLGARCRVTATRDRRRALEGADFVVCTIGVGGIEATRIDLEVPLRFGVRQTVGDTLGMGGIFRSARSIPEVMRLCADIRELCPDALLMNYTNPMAMHCLAIQRATRVKAVGLCHGVQGTARTMRMLTAMLDYPAAAIERHFRRPWNHPIRVREWQEWIRKGEDPELSYLCAGINHMAFFLRFESGGRDLYPLLWKAFDLPHVYRMEPVRFELFRWLGYFMTETSGHTAEYTPYFLKDGRETRARHLRVKGYVKDCRDLDAAYRALRRSVLGGKPVVATPYSPSQEYASRIMNAIVTGRPFVFNGNVHNRGGALIGNLPGDSCVEVPCVASRTGIAPVAVGELPPACAALIRTNINVQDLAVRGILEERRDLIYQAAMLDPNTGSTLTLPAIRKLCDAMFAAHAKRLPRGLARAGKTITGRKRA